MRSAGVASRRRRCHTNAGRFLSLTADYRAGRLTGEGEKRFEDICYQLHRLYKERFS
jgi:hypothetical protein